MDIQQIPSPCYVLDEALLRKNLQLIDRVQKEAGISIILAFKGFAMWSVFPIVREYLPGATASSLHEAQLCYEEMGVKAHSYAVAYRPDEFDELMNYSSHITFNSLTQFRLYRHKMEGSGISAGLRVNPGWSPVSTDLYNPAFPGTRLGVAPEKLPDELPAGIEGLHFHVLCENDSYEFEKALRHFEKNFSAHLPGMKWVNFGGGHLITRKGYDVEHLISVLKDFRSRYPQLEVIMEPGSAIAWEAGILVATVLDIVESGDVRTAVLDVSFTAHMPDTLEMPYRPNIRGASSEVKDGDVHVYRLGGVSCLSGDFLEAYTFEAPLEEGQKIVLEDMIHYTMVKTTTFNGVSHPSIAVWREKEGFEMIREFGYEDYKGRLS